MTFNNGGAWIDDISRTISDVSTRSDDVSKQHLTNLAQIYKEYSPQVNSQYTYDYEGGFQDVWMDPERLLLTKVGDCEDYAVLAASMASKLGIPVDNLRVVNGLLGYGGHSPISHTVLLYDSSVSPFALKDTSSGKKEFSNPDTIHVIDLVAPAKKNIQSTEDATYISELTGGYAIERVRRADQNGVTALRDSITPLLENVLDASKHPQVQFDTVSELNAWINTLNANHPQFINEPLDIVVNDVNYASSQARVLNDLAIANQRDELIVNIRGVGVSLDAFGRRSTPERDLEDIYDYLNVTVPEFYNDSMSGSLLYLKLNDLNISDVQSYSRYMADPERDISISWQQYLLDIIKTDHASIFVENNSSTIDSIENNLTALKNNLTEVKVKRNANTAIENQRNSFLTNIYSILRLEMGWDENADDETKLEKIDETIPRQYNPEEDFKAMVDYLNANVPELADSDGSTLRAASLWRDSNTNAKFNNLLNAIEHRINLRDGLNKIGVTLNSVPLRSNTTQDLSDIKEYLTLTVPEFYVDGMDAAFLYSKLKALLTDNDFSDIKNYNDYMADPDPGKTLQTYLLEGLLLLVNL